VDALALVEIAAHAWRPAAEFGLLLSIGGSSVFDQGPNPWGPMLEISGGRRYSGD